MRDTEQEQARLLGGEQNEGKEKTKVNKENEVQREVLKMPMVLRVVRILMIIYAAIILVGLIGIWRCGPVTLVALALWSWFLLSMAKAIKARKNWPRCVMAGISAISLFGCICMFPCIFSIIDGGGMPPGYVHWAFVSVVFAVFCWVPTAILFLPSSNDWFATKKQYGNKEV
jgi:hypothetical protein